MKGDWEQTWASPAFSLMSSKLQSPGVLWEPCPAWGLCVDQLLLARLSWVQAGRRIQAGLGTVFHLKGSDIPSQCSQHFARASWKETLSSFWGIYENTAILLAWGKKLGRGCLRTKPMERETKPRIEKKVIVYITSSWLQLCLKLFPKLFGYNKLL